MNQQERLNLEKIFWLGIYLQYCRSKAQSIATSIKASFEVRGGKGDGSLTGALELINDTLKEYNITPQVQSDIQRWIDYLNKEYAQISQPLFERGILNPAYLKPGDANALVKDTEHWRNANKSKLISGRSSFLNEDILKHLPDSTKNDLSDAIKCILLHLPTPAAMITFRVSEDILRLYYEKKTQKSPVGKWWKEIIDELSKMEDVKKQHLNDYLNYLRTKRNEAEHPGKIFTQDECEHAFMQVINLIKEVSKEIN